MSSIPEHTAAERFLRLFATVEPREGATAFLLIGNIFLILTAYYLIKPVREGWLAVSVLADLSSIEIKAYSAFAQTLLFVLVLPLYAWLATRWPRRKLLNRVGMFFLGALLVFWLTRPGLIFEQIPYLGIAFYLFVGVFSVTLVAQFWSFASDLYGEEKGRRLFPLIALGASSGAVAGSWIGEQLLETADILAFDMILIATLPLAGAIALGNWTDRRGTLGDPGARTRERWQEPAAPNADGPFQLIGRHRYLAATAALTLIFSWVVASGDNILFAFVQESLRGEFAYISSDADAYRRMLNAATTAFYGNLFFWVNLLGLLIQAFLVSRLLRYAGFATLLLATPLVSLVAYSSMLVTPLLALVKVVKIAENASSYSINNTARHMLWLPTTKAMLYQAKPTVDTLFVRIGDGLAALTVLIGTRVLNVGVSGFVLWNLMLVVAWIAIGIYLNRQYRIWQKRAEAQS